MRCLMSIKKHIPENMQAIANVLATDPEAKDRYKKADNGAKEWFCFSRWAAEDMARWTNSDAMTFRDALVDRLNSIDIAYILQYETNPDVVTYLKERLVAAVERETKPDELAKRGDWTTNARTRWRHITSNPPQEAESWMGRKIQIGDCFYSKMMPIMQALSEDSDTKHHYELLRHGGKEWLCYSWWIAEDRTRWNDPDAAEYRDSLTSWLGSLDIVNVLKLETDVNLVAYLKKRLVAAMKRETTRKRLKRRAAIIDKGLHKPWEGPEGMTTTSKAADSRGCGMICRFYSAMRGDADYLRGNPPGAGFWTHPDCPLYLEWYNKYDAPTCGLSRAQ